MKYIGFPDLSIVNIGNFSSTALPVINSKKKTQLNLPLAHRSSLKYDAFVGKDSKETLKFIFIENIL